MECLSIASSSASLSSLPRFSSASGSAEQEAPKPGGPGRGTKLKQGMRRGAVAARNWRSARIKGKTEGSRTRALVRGLGPRTLTKQLETRLLHLN